MSSSDRNNGNDGYEQDFTALAAFTSGDAHNGCRALFNGTAGWAFFGPAGSIDPSALPPGTESYPCDFKTESKSARTSPPSRPGEGLGRKTNDTRSAYLDAEDLRHLVRGTSEVDADVDGACGGEGGGEDGAQCATAASRKGRPIVLTLQAILAATSPASPAAAAIEAAAAAAATAAPEMVAAGTRAEDCAGANDSTRHPPESGGSPPPVAIADRAQFPPLLLRGASADKGPGLFLAPPITMVKNSALPPAERPGAEAAGAPGMQSGGTDGGGGRVSCSEAVAATSVAEAAAHIRDGGGGGSGDGAEAGAVAGGGGMSRIGWWLRWATTTASGADNADATVNEQRGADYLAGGGGGGGGVVSLETSNGADGWQVVSALGSGAPPAAIIKSEDEDDESGSWCDFADADVGETNGALVPLVVRDGGGGGGGEGGGEAPAPAVTIEDALKRAAGGTIYNDGSSSFAGDDEAHEEDENSAVYGANDDRDERVVPQIVSPNIPRSFRDTLMAPSTTGAVRFSDSKELLRVRAAAAAPSGSSSSSSNPTLVAGGADGGAVFLWRKAAAGEAARADRAKGPTEDEDPYYARKRVGAFAFKTKPRGKAHK